DKDKLPQNLTLALGTAEVLPIQMATAYAAIANGGLRINPYFIEKVVDRQGRIIFQAEPKRVCRPCEEPASAPVMTADGNVEAPDPALPGDASASTGISGSGSDITVTAPAGATPDYPVALRIMRPRAARQMYSILQDVIRHGTGRGALSLGRSDLAGKTGTTNDARDAWFAGFNAGMVAVSWVGFDDPQSLGRVEYGGYAALPLWNQYMATALRGMPYSVPPTPAGLVTERINKNTGTATTADDPDGIDEMFPSELAPPPPAPASP
ncbi:MAG: penicillin-binding transpeptidase domain-containing protein, partial [Perlucidibaca sp.]